MNLIAEATRPPGSGSGSGPETGPPGPPGSGTGSGPETSPPGPPGSGSGSGPETSNSHLFAFRAGRLTVSRYCLVQSVQRFAQDH